MFEQKSNHNIVNNREICTRAHDAVLFTNVKPKSEKYKTNILYKGALAWNSMSVAIRKSQTYIILKGILSVKLIKEI